MIDLNKPKHHKEFNHRSSYGGYVEYDTPFTYQDILDIIKREINYKIDLDLIELRLGQLLLEKTGKCAVNTFDVRDMISTLRDEGILDSREFKIL